MVTVHLIHMIPASQPVLDRFLEYFADGEALPRTIEGPKDIDAASLNLGRLGHRTVTDLRWRHLPKQIFRIPSWIFRSDIFKGVFRHRNY